MIETLLIPKVSKGKLVIRWSMSRTRSDAPPDVYLWVFLFLILHCLPKKLIDILLGISHRFLITNLCVQNLTSIFLSHTWSYGLLQYGELGSSFDSYRLDLMIPWINTKIQLEEIVRIFDAWTFRIASSYKCHIHDGGMTLSMNVNWPSFHKY